MKPAFEWPACGRRARSQSLPFESFFMREAYAIAFTCRYSPSPDELQMSYFQELVSPSLSTDASGTAARYMHLGQRAMLSSGVKRLKLIERGMLIPTSD
jgi:hypothetical protein